MHDIKCHTLAAQFLSDYTLSDHDRLQYIEVLAEEIQRTIEKWLLDAESDGRLAYGLIGDEPR